MPCSSIELQLLLRMKYDNGAGVRRQYDGSGRVHPLR